MLSSVNCQPLFQNVLYETKSKKKKRKNKVLDFAIKYYKKKYSILVISSTTLLF